ncbi:hypothetical protein ACFQU7_26195 [Pseudoroseomonas wenyumeiae]
MLDDSLAFCGGIDMTSDRWDTRQHLDADPGRRRPNGSPYKPWHDATMALEERPPVPSDRWRATAGAPRAGANCSRWKAAPIAGPRRWRRSSRMWMSPSLAPIRRCRMWSRSVRLSAFTST